MSDPLVQIFSEGLNVPVDELDEATSPDNNDQWDSLAAMNLVTLIEDAFDVRLKTRDIMRMQSIGIAREVLIEKGVEGL